MFFCFVLFLLLNLFILQTEKISFYVYIHDGSEEKEIDKDGPEVVYQIREVLGAYVSLYWVGLGRVGLGWIGLDWVSGC